MSTRNIGIACLALALVLAILATFNVLGGAEPSSPTEKFSWAATMLSPLIALVTGLYLLTRSRNYS